MFIPSTIKQQIAMMEYADIEWVFNRMDKSLTAHNWSQANHKKVKLQLDNIFKQSNKTK